MGVTTGTIALTGCSNIHPDSSSANIVIGQIDIVNAHSIVHEISILLRSPDELVYWGTHKVDAIENSIAGEKILRGPWQHEGSELELFVRLDDVIAEGVTEDSDDIARVQLDERASGCLKLTITVTGDEQLFITHEEDDEFCGSEGNRSTGRNPSGDEKR